MKISSKKVMVLVAGVVLLAFGLFAGEKAMRQEVDGIKASTAASEVVRFILNTENIAVWQEVERGFTIRLTEDGRKLFCTLSIENIEKPVELYVETLLVNSPVIRSPICGGGLLLTADQKMREKIRPLLPSYFLEMPKIVVKLKGTAYGDNQPRDLHLSIKIELESKEDMAAVEAVMPKVVDQLQTFLRELRIKDIHPHADMRRLQKKLLSILSTVAYPIEVKDVLFQEVLIVPRQHKQDR